MTLCDDTGCRSEAVTTAQLRFPLHGGVSPQRMIDCVWRRSFLQRCHRLGYCDDTSGTFNSICTDADERLFSCITSNRRHLLHPVLPPQREQHYLLRKRSHGYKLPEHISSLTGSNFLTRMLYENINRFDDICYFLLYFHIHCLVAVCQPFIKLLLTYLLTYLLTIMSVCRDIERNYAPCGLRGYSVSWLDVVKGD